MKPALTPQEILTQHFAITNKGYDKEQVSSFLTHIAEQMEAEILERERQKKKMEKMKETIENFEKKEDILRDTLIAAQKFSQEIKGNAKKEAELLLKEAEIKADDIINRAILRQKELKDEIRTLKFKRLEVENDMMNMLSTLKEMIESYRKDDGDFEKIEYLTKTQA